MNDDFFENGVGVFGPTPAHDSRKFVTCVIRRFMLGWYKLQTCTSLRTMIFLKTILVNSK